MLKFSYFLVTDALYLICTETAVFISLLVISLYNARIHAFHCLLYLTVVMQTKLLPQLYIDARTRTYIIDFNRDEFGILCCNQLATGVSLSVW